MSTLGEHTRAYLKETGLSEDEIASFAGKAQGRRAADGGRPDAKVLTLRLFIRRLRTALPATAFPDNLAGSASTIRNAGRTTHRREHQ